MTEPLTLRDLDAIGVERIKGVGDKKLASLHDVGVDTVLDLLTTYPRRWVDRTNEARVSDLLPGQEALVLVSVRSVTKRAMRNRRTMVNVVVGDGSGRGAWHEASPQGRPGRAANPTGPRSPDIKH